tara:strand:- start:8 stop:298 length:291 start_codon:yes stop_codon:yes gene_type:complete
MKKLNNTPYVNEAIFKPTITRALSALLKIIAEEINIIVHPTATNLEILTEVILGSQSLIVDEDNEFIEELRVDMAADKTPAITMPLNPTGKTLLIT